MVEQLPVKRQLSEGIQIEKRGELLETRTGHAEGNQQPSPNKMSGKVQRLSRKGVLHFYGGSASHPDRMMI